MWFEVYGLLFVKLAAVINKQQVNGTASYKLPTTNNKLLTKNKNTAMLPIAYYLLKVMICSGILLGYYWLALRNKIFHHYNRFYLLAAVILSLSLPVIKISFWDTGAAAQPAVIKVLQAVSDSDVYLDNLIVSTPRESWDAAQWASAGYSVVAIIMLITLFQTLFTIYLLLKKYPTQKIGTISFVNTEAKSTPFSFLNYIFWNSNIDTASPTGKQIFKHEVAHIQEKHTHDKIFMNLVLAVYWCNPFFWLIRRELNMIHEFIADKKAVEDSDTAAFAAMILQATYPQHRFQLTNNFFYSPIKRRLAMLVKNTNAKVTYFGRILVLPLAILVFAAFTFKAKEPKPLKKAEPGIADFISGQTAKEKFTTLFDTTRTAKKQNIKTSINNNTCTISADTLIFDNTVKRDIESASTLNTLVIVNGKEFDCKPYPNLHIIAKTVKGYGKNNKEAISKYGSRAGNGVLVFDDAVVEEPVTAINMDEVAKKYDEKALVVLDGKEAGNGKEALAKVDEKAIDHVYVLKGDKAVAKYGEKGTNGVIEIYSKKENGLPANVLYVVDEVARDKEYVNTIKPDQIQSINVLKGENAVHKYGEKGKEGVIEVTTKKHTDRLTEVVVAGYPLARTKEYNNSNTGAPAAIALDKMNVLYIGVDNPVTAAAPGVDPEDLILTVTEGNAGITGKNGKYNIRVTTPGQLTIGVMKRGDSKIISQSSFRVKRIPDPVNGIVPADYDIKTTVAAVQEPILGLDGVHTVRMKSETFRKSKMLTAGNGYEVVSATVYFSGTGFPKVAVYNLNGNTLSQLSEYTSRCSSGSVVTFDNVRVKGPNGYYATVGGLSIALYDENNKGQKEVTGIYRVPLKVHMLNGNNLDTYNMVGDGSFTPRAGEVYFVNDKQYGTPPTIKKEDVVYMETYDAGAAQKTFGGKYRYGVTFIKTKV